MQKRFNHALHGDRAGQVADRGNQNSRPMAALISRCRQLNINHQHMWI